MKVPLRGPILDEKIPRVKFRKYIIIKTEAVDRN
jgi:hypothetical protein